MSGTVSEKQKPRSVKSVTEVEPVRKTFYVIAREEAEINTADEVEAALAES